MQKDAKKRVTKGRKGAGINTTERFEFYPPSGDGARFDRQDTTLFMK